MKKIDLIVTVLLFILGALCYVFFEVLHLHIVDDPVANHLLDGTFSRAGLSLLFIWLIYLFGGMDYLLFNKNFGMMLLWSLPCFMVAFVNFPWNSTFGTHKFSITRTDLIGYYILYIIFIAIFYIFLFK